MESKLSRIKKELPHHYGVYTMMNKNKTLFLLLLLETDSSPVSFRLVLARNEIKEHMQLSRSLVASR